MNKKPVVVIGIGEMGAVFARGLLRIGHPVYPVTRKTQLKALAKELPKPCMVLVAVGEADLPEILGRIPRRWRSHLALLQNELLPPDYAHLPDPTVISVWFEKKPGQDSRVIIPSPARGPNARLLRKALGAIDIPVSVIESAEDMLVELVIKNLYILTSNIAGLRTGGTVSTLWAEQEPLARAVANDVIDLQEALTGARFDREQLFEGLQRAFAGDPDHQCMGRSAPARLARALLHADRLDLEVPTLRDIQAQITEPQEHDRHDG